MKPNLTKLEVTRKNLIASLIGTIEAGPTDISRRKKHYLKSKHYGTSRPL